MSIWQTRHPILKGMALCLVAYASAGCAQVSWGRLGADRAAPRTLPIRDNSVKPAIDSAKPADATRDSEDRHPSRWRQKLRVRYL